MAMLLKFDLHVHTLSRGRVYIDALQLKTAIEANGLDGVAVTNFFDIEHARWLKEKLPEHVIVVGQEVWSLEGHIIGLGLTQRVSDLQTARKTVEDIHAQGGIAVGVHPFMHHGLGARAIDAGVDALEVYNGLIGGLFIFNVMAERMAWQHGLPRLSSSDTSSAEFVGWNQTHVDVQGAIGVIGAIRQGRTRTVQRALPLPWAFVMRNMLGAAHVEPWSVHATPCMDCGASWVIRFKPYPRRCLSCGVVEMSRIACCHGHYYCVPCLSLVGHERALALRQREYLS